MLGDPGQSLRGACGRLFGAQRLRSGLLRILQAFEAAQLEDRPVQVHQPFKKRLVFTRVLAQQFQPGMQLAEQAGNHFDQFGGLLERHLLLDAPEQVRHHRAEAFGVNLLAGVCQSGMRHGQRPGAKQEVQHDAGHLFKVGAIAQVKGDLVRLALPVLGKAQRTQHLAAVFQLQLVLFVPGGFEGGQRAAKRPGIVDGQRIKLVERLADQ